MVSRCWVPRCRTRGSNCKYYCVPFTNKVRWPMWLRLCPFLRQYSGRKLERIRLCYKHFLPEHIQPNLKLKPFAVPLLNLNGNVNKEKESDLNLKIVPTANVAEPFSFEVVSSSVGVNEPSLEEEHLSNIQSSDFSELPIIGETFELPFNDFDCSPPLSPDIQEDTEHPETSTTPTTSGTTALSDQQKLSFYCLVECQVFKRFRINSKETAPLKNVLHDPSDVLTDKLRHLQLKYSKLKSKYSCYAPKTRLYLKKYKILRRFGNVLVDSQLDLTCNIPKGCHYTNEEKIFALSLLKLSPKCYRFLSQYLTLPRKFRINHLLSNIPVRPGINEFIFQHLADAALDKLAIHRQCSLIFSEIIIRKNLHFNFLTGVIEGFEDIGSGKHTNNIADKALVFMLRGLFSPWKIPIAFYFTRDGMETNMLRNIIKEVILAVFKTGFTVRATISDQHSAKVAAMKLLISETDTEVQPKGSGCANICYRIGPHKLYHIYDVHHLLKCFCSNFQKKNLLVGNQIAKWECIAAFHKFYGTGDHARSTTITKKHINPSTCDRMKVELSTQVFSMEFATLLEIYIKSILYYQQEHSTSVNVNIEDNFLAADVIRFISKLVESLNGFGSLGKSLKHALSHNSEHIEFWNEAIRKLSSMSFDSSNQRQEKPLSLTHFMHNIETIKQLWSDLCSIDGVKFLNLRRLNQSPIETFFGQIQAHDNFNTNPTCTNFLLAFKSLLIKNITTGKSLYIKHSSDDNKMLGILKNFVNQQRYGSYTEDLSYNEISFIENSMFQENLLQQISVPHLARAICHSLMSNLNCKDCDDCKTALLSDSRSQQLSNLREFIDNLYYPSSKFSQVVWQSMYIIDKMLPSISNVYVYSDLIHILTRNIDTTWYNCDIHKEAVMKASWLYIINMQTKQWCVNFNNQVNNTDYKFNDIEMATLILGKVTKSFNKRSVRRHSV